MPDIKTTTENHVLNLYAGHCPRRKRFYVSVMPVEIDGISRMTDMLDMGNFLYLENSARNSEKKRNHFEQNWKQIPEIAEFVGQMAKKFNLELA